MAVGKKRAGKVTKKEDMSAMKKKRQTEEKEKEDEIILSESDEGPMSGDEGDESEDEAANETAADKRLRIAKAYVQDLRKQAEADEESDDDKDNEGNRDSRVSEQLRTSLRESRGYQMRQIAQRVVIPEGGEASGGKVVRAHQLAVTALALTDDARFTYTCSKDGAIVKWDMESGTKSAFSSGPGDTRHSGAGYPGSYVQQGETSKQAILCAAVSHDGKYLATAGMDRRVHIWDTTSHTHIKAFPGHKDIVTSLAFRDGTHQLFSGSYDRTVKSWSLGDMMYIDTLYGHQGHIIGLDCDHRERPVTVSRDHTCRMWKIQDETHLVFRGKGSLDCCCLAGTGAWVSGADDGCVSLWGMMKKKPVHLQRCAHLPTPELGAAASWVQSVASVRSADVVASGAGDGFVRLWALKDGNHTIKDLYKIPVRGFVNAMAISRSAKLLVAGIGQEPRLGRWARDSGARNGLLIHKIELADE